MSHERGSKQSEQAVRANKQTDERVPSTSVCIFGCSDPQCNVGEVVSNPNRRARVCLKPDLSRHISFILASNSVPTDHQCLRMTILLHLHLFKESLPKSFYFLYIEKRILKKGRGSSSPLSIFLCQISLGSNKREGLLSSLPPSSSIPLRHFPYTYPPQSP